MTRLLTLFVALAAAGPAAACINDSDTRTREREFKSQYLSQAAPPEQVSPPSNAPLALATVGGAGLLAAALFAAGRSGPRAV